MTNQILIAMPDQPIINSLADLRIEREILRTKIDHQEEILKDHYNSFTHQLMPLFRIINFVSGNRLFKGILKEGDRDGATAGSGDWLAMLLKILVAGTAGGFIFKKTKKNLIRTAIALALEQGIKFAQGKDLNIYLDKLKEWLAKRKEEKSEDVEREDSKDEDSKD